MNVIQITPGAGGTFYCQNCLRDGALVRALRRRGCDVTLVPLYLPILIDAEELGEETPVFFGGINAYLQQSSGLFRRTPRWVDRLFDLPWMLRQAAAREGSTSAAELGPMTFSMLLGRDGRQRKELDRLLAWLIQQERPDVVHISNALLLGVAAEIRRALNAPVVCGLQDEDTWIEAMNAEWSERCWTLMAEKARAVDAFVSVSHWYGEKMTDRLQLPPRKLSVVPLGIEVDADEPACLPQNPPVLGYLSRIGEAQGFGLLADAFICLKQDSRFGRLRLKATGGVTSGDRRFVAEVSRKFARAGVAGDVEILADFGKAARREFLRTVTALSVPAPRGEAFGLFILEAGACGVPVVQPDAGAFREVVEMTGGGLVYDPRRKEALPETLARVLQDRQLARELGANGRESVRERFTSDTMAERMLAVYESVGSS